MSELLRVLPASPDAEKFVLGSIKLHGKSDAEIVDVVGSEDLSLERHDGIFDWTKDLYDRRINRLTLVDELRNDGQIDSIDGLPYLPRLAQGLAAVAGMHGYVRITENKPALSRNGRDDRVRS